MLTRFIIAFLPRNKHLLTWNNPQITGSLSQLSSPSLPQISLSIPLLDLRIYCSQNIHHPIHTLACPYSSQSLMLKPPPPYCRSYKPTQLWTESLWWAIYPCPLELLFNHTPSKPLSYSLLSCQVLSLPTPGLNKWLKLHSKPRAKTRSHSKIYDL